MNLLLFILRKVLKIFEKVEKKKERKEEKILNYEIFKQMQLITECQKVFRIFEL